MSSKDSINNDGECPTHRSNDEASLDIPFASSTTPEAHDVVEPIHSKGKSMDQPRRLYIKVIAVVVIVVVLAVAVSVGVYCGQGNCNSDPEPEPVDPIPAPSPSPPTSEPTPIVDPTRAPSPSPPTPAIDFSATLVAYINNITLSGRTLSTDGVTPEDEALKFMIANETTTAEELLTSGVVRFRMRQRFALLTLWFQQSINGVFTPSWGTTPSFTFIPITNWGSSNECSVWYGVSCVLADVGDGAGEQRTVSAIELTRGHVGGSLPADIGLLTSLITLDLSKNSIEGTLPESISRCTDLMTINLGSNKFVGSLSTSIGNIRKLTQIDLSANQFGGTLPESIGEWTSMQHFNVYNNLFGGTIPTSINSWTGLASANFQLNGFTGTMPSQICNITGFPSSFSSPIAVDCPQVQCDCCWYIC